MKRIISLAVVLVALALGLGAPPAVAAQGSLAGTWTSIDNDGSNQVLTITGSGRHTYAMSFTDDAASSLCGGGPALATGTGLVAENRLLMRAAAICLPGGNVLRGVIHIVFTQVDVDMLVDDSGVRWFRA